MAIDFAPTRWKKIKHDSQKWWLGKLGRPLIQVRLKGNDPRREAPPIPYYEFTSFYDLSITAAQIVDCWDYELSATRYLGDGFPQIWPNFGAGAIAAFFGARIENVANTTWFIPEQISDIDRLNFKFRENNIWYQRICAILKETQKKWHGSVQIGMTDLGGNLDILSTFRPSEKLLLDLYDQPDQVKRLTWEAHQAWWAYFDRFTACQRPFNPGHTCWTPLFSERPYYMLQCDFSYMLGPRMFTEFVLPELTASAERLGNAFYHLDGTGQLPHLDHVLAVAAIKGVQWVPGDGTPDASHWPEVYRRIYQAGKLCQVFHNQYKGGLDFLDILNQQVGSVENVCYIIDGDMAQEREVQALLKRYGIN